MRASIHLCGSFISAVSDYEGKEVIEKNAERNGIFDGGDYYAWMTIGYRGVS